MNQMVQRKVEVPQALEQIVRPESVSDKGPAILECEKDKVIQQIEENDQHREIAAYLSGGNDDEVEQKMQSCLIACQERSGLDKGHMDIWECGIRWAVESKKKEAVEGKNEGHERVQLAAKHGGLAAHALPSHVGLGKRGREDTIRGAAGK